MSLYRGGYQPEGGSRPRVPTTGTGVKPPLSVARLEQLLAEARGKLVERDVEIAGMKTELARLYDRIADLERSK